MDIIRKKICVCTHKCSMPVVIHVTPIISTYLRMYLCIYIMFSMVNLFYKYTQVQNKYLVHAELWNQLWFRIRKTRTAYLTKAICIISTHLCTKSIMCIRMWVIITYISSVFPQTPGGTCTYVNTLSMRISLRLWPKLSSERTLMKKSDRFQG